MTLTDEQKRAVASWIAGGAKLSDIQSRIATEFDLRLTYMDVRLLVDDLKLTPLDPPEPPRPQNPPDAEKEVAAAPPIATELPPTGSGKVTLTTDTLARPGTMVSGSVTFSDGKKATWYLDQMGRLGVVPEEHGYRPPTQDVQTFQMQLDQELQKLGY